MTVDLSQNDCIRELYLLTFEWILTLLPLQRILLHNIHNVRSIARPKVIHPTMRHVCTVSDCG